MGDFRYKIEFPDGTVGYVDSDDATNATEAYDMASEQVRNRTREEYSNMPLGDKLITATGDVGRTIGNAFTLGGMDLAKGQGTPVKQYPDSETTWSGPEQERFASEQAIARMSDESGAGSVVNPALASQMLGYGKQASLLPNVIKPFQDLIGGAGIPRTISGMLAAGVDTGALMGIEEGVKGGTPEQIWEGVKGGLAMGPVGHLVGNFVGNLFNAGAKGVAKAATKGLSTPMVEKAVTSFRPKPGVDLGITSPADALRRGTPAVEPLPIPPARVEEPAAVPPAATEAAPPPTTKEALTESLATTPKPSEMTKAQRSQKMADDANAEYKKLIDAESERTKKPGYKPSPTRTRRIDEARTLAGTLSNRAKRQAAEETAANPPMPSATAKPKAKAKVPPATTTPLGEAGRAQEARSNISNKPPPKAKEAPKAKPEPTPQQLRDESIAAIQKEKEGMRDRIKRVLDNEQIMANLTPAEREGLEKVYRGDPATKAGRQLNRMIGWPMMAAGLAGGGLTQFLTSNPAGWLLAGGIPALGTLGKQVRNRGSEKVLNEYMDSLKGTPAAKPKGPISQETMDDMYRSLRGLGL
jgi:hypothetical protein